MKKHLNESGPFNRIARETVTNPALSLKAKGLLTLILGFPEDWDFSIAGLLPFLQEGREAILSALRELFENGYADRSACRFGNGRFGKYEYSFYESPHTAIPLADKPSAVSPQMDEPVKEGKQMMKAYIRENEQRLLRLRSGKKEGGEAEGYEKKK